MEHLGALNAFVQTADAGSFAAAAIKLGISASAVGKAVARLLEETPPDHPAAYLGDDLTDERAFAALGTRGLSVLVRPAWRPTRARAWLRPPEEVRAFLACWLRCTQGPPRRCSP